MKKAINLVHQSCNTFLKEFSPQVKRGNKITCILTYHTSSLEYDVLPVKEEKSVLVISFETLDRIPRKQKDYSCPFKTRKGRMSYVYLQNKTTTKRSI